MQRGPRNDLVAAAVLARVGGRPTSLDTLKACLDPFHDTEIDPQGWPDLTTSPSCVQVYKASATIAAPSGTPATGTWDCHIFNSPVFNNSASNTNINPFSSTITFSQANGNNLNFGTYSGNGSVPFSPLGVNFVSFPTGSPPASFSSVTPSSTVAIGNLTVPLSLSQGATRVFASGIEVHNTTAELYRGGSVLVYRQPVDDNAYKSNICLQGGAATNFIGSVSSLDLPDPPATLSQALELKGSKQWGAEMGVYQVYGMHTSELATNGNTFLLPTYYQTSPTADATRNTQTMTTVAVGSQSIIAAPSMLWTEFDVHGSWFTGLTSQTVLTVNWNVYLERFPTQIQQDLVLLAKQSPEYDVMGMELISATMRTMPVATFVGNNSTGSWFSDILQTGADYIAPLLSAMPHPVAKGIGAAITGGATMMKAWNKRPAAERNAINQKTKNHVKGMASSRPMPRPKKGKGPAPRQRRTIAQQPRKNIGSWASGKFVAPVNRGKRGRGLAPIKPGYKKDVSTWVSKRGNVMHDRIEIAPLD